MKLNIDKRWENFLNPETLRSRLAFASVFITAYEMLENPIVENLRNFYVCGFDGDKQLISEDYKKEVFV